MQTTGRPGTHRCRAISFGVNLPIGLATAVFARRVIRPDRGIGLRAGADFPGALLITGAMMLGVFTIAAPAAQYSWLAARTLELGACSAVLLAAFVIRQLTARQPLMPLRVLASRNVAGANLVQVLSTAGMFGMFFLGSLYLRRILGYDPLRIGLAFLPATLLFGTGAGLCFPALMTLAMSGATPRDAGLASGLVNTTAQVGGAIGLAVLATVSASRSAALMARGRPVAAALADGYHLAFWIAFGLVAVAIVVCGTVLRSKTSIPNVESPVRELASVGGEMSEVA